MIASFVMELESAIAERIKKIAKLEEILLHRKKLSDSQSIRSAMQCNARTPAR
jgi:hypothetical protein